MKRRGDYPDDDIPALQVSPSTGHYSTGFSARIEDGVPVEPVSAIGPIGFVTRPITKAALKRLQRTRKA